MIESCDLSNFHKIFKLDQCYISYLCACIRMKECGYASDNASSYSGEFMRFFVLNTSNFIDSADSRIS